MSHFSAVAAVLNGGALSASDYIRRLINRIRLLEIRIKTPRWKLTSLTISDK